MLLNLIAFFFLNVLEFLTGNQNWKTVSLGFTVGSESHITHASNSLHVIPVDSADSGFYACNPAGSLCLSGSLAPCFLSL